MSGYKLAVSSIYCSTVWSGISSRKFINCYLYEILLFAWLTNTRKFDHISPVLRDCDVTQLYKIVNRLTPSYLNSYISKRTGIHSHNYTRFRENLEVPMFRTATAQCSFHYRSINTWNSLSASKRNSRTLTNFKRCAKLDTEN